MRHFVIILLTTAFLLNIITVAAWAKPCMMKADNGSVMSQKQNMSEMPCHKQKDKKNPNKHCKDICLCFHVSISQTPILGSDIDLLKHDWVAKKFVISDEIAASFAVTPPRRPPKHVS